MDALCKDVQSLTMKTLDNALQKKCDELDLLLLSDSDEQELPDNSCFNDKMKEFRNHLTCPECKETVEILNWNAEFSLLHHSQKHKDLSVINSSLDFDYKKGVDFVCPICTDVIPIFNNDVALSVSLHFDEKQHNGKTDKVHLNKDSEFIDNIFFDFLKWFDKHRMYFMMEGSDVFCKLCNFTVWSLKKDGADASQTLSRHIGHRYHRDQHDITTCNLANDTYDDREIDQHSNVSIDDFPFDKLISESKVISENHQFIEELGINYFCTLCQKQINNSPNESMQYLNLILHLMGLQHISKVSQLPKRKRVRVSPDRTKTTSANKSFNSHSSIHLESIAGNISQSFPEIYEHLNVMHFRNSGCTMYCEVCEVTVGLTKSGSYLKSHCQSEAHVENLKRYNTPSQSWHSSLETSHRTKYRSRSSEFINDPVLAPHLKYVIENKDSNLIFCLLCNIGFCREQHLKEHVLGLAHTQRWQNAMNSSSISVPDSGQVGLRAGLETSECILSVSQTATDTSVLLCGNQLKNEVQAQSYSSESEINNCISATKKVIDQVLNELAQDLLFAPHVQFFGPGSKNSLWCHLCDAPVLSISKSKFKEHVIGYPHNAYYKQHWLYGGIDRQKGT